MKSQLNNQGIRNWYGLTNDIKTQIGQVFLERSTKETILKGLQDVFTGLHIGYLIRGQESLLGPGIIEIRGILDELVMYCYSRLPETEIDITSFITFIGDIKGWCMGEEDLQKRRKLTDSITTFLHDLRNWNTGVETYFNSTPVQIQTERKPSDKDRTLKSGEYISKYIKSDFLEVGVDLDNWGQLTDTKILVDSLTGTGKSTMILDWKTPTVILKPTRVLVDNSYEDLNSLYIGDREIVKVYGGKEKSDFLKRDNLENVQVIVGTYDQVQTIVNKLRLDDTLGRWCFIVDEVHNFLVDTGYRDFTYLTLYYYLQEEIKKFIGITGTRNLIDCFNWDIVYTVRREIPVDITVYNHKDRNWNFRNYLINRLEHTELTDFILYVNNSDGKEGLKEFSRHLKKLYPTLRTAVVYSELNEYKNGDENIYFESINEDGEWEKYKSYTDIIRDGDITGYDIILSTSVLYAGVSLRDSKNRQVSVYLDDRDVCLENVIQVGSRVRNSLRTEINVKGLKVGTGMDKGSLDSMLWGQYFKRKDFYLDIYESSEKLHTSEFTVKQTQQMYVELLGKLRVYRELLDLQETEEGQHYSIKTVFNDVKLRLGIVRKELNSMGWFFINEDFYPVLLPSKILNQMFFTTHLLTWKGLRQYFTDLGITYREINSQYKDVKSLKVYQDVETGVHKSVWDTVRGNLLKLKPYLQDLEGSPVTTVKLKLQVILDKREVRTEVDSIVKILRSFSYVGGTTRQFILDNYETLIETEWISKTKLNQWVTYRKLKDTVYLYRNKELSIKELSTVLLSDEGLKTLDERGFKREGRTSTKQKMQDTINTIDRLFSSGGLTVTKPLPKRVITMFDIKVLGNVRKRDGKDLYWTYRYEI